MYEWMEGVELLKNVMIDGYTIVEFGKDAACAKDFLSVPKKLYPTGVCPQNPGEEKQLLNANHALSGYFRFVPFLLRKGNDVIGRAALTFYPEDPSLAYLGFFEMQDDHQAASALFTALERYAAGEGCRRIVGPMNASFWLGYRMKADRFDEPPYFGEPYNLSYYPSLWRENGYEVSDEYISNQYRTLHPGDYQNRRYEQRLQRFLDAGYIIRPPAKDNWDTVIREVYRLITKLYSDFPGFSLIEEADFIKNYSGLKLILDFSLCRVVYLNNEAVAFTITVPDYGALLNDLQLWKLPKMLWKRRYSHRHVVLYMGVEPEHKGLGTAMVQELIQEFSARHTGPIGALIHKGKITQGYAAGLIKAQNTYLLWSKNIDIQ